jgi:NAD(P)-dependent dehydrogenase (short-subunit alcohol dehydrogenase family)
MRLQGKVAIVTGASRGLGRASAVEFARQGASVVVAARTENPSDDVPEGTIHETVEIIRDSGGRAVAIRTDLASDTDIQAMVDAAVEHFGGVDILLNNASIGTVGDISTTEIADWDACIGINLRSQFVAIRACVPHMRERGGGSILNMSSYLAMQVPDPDDPDPVMQQSTDASGPGITVYSTTKAAIQRLTLGAAADLAQYNISVNSVAPSWTETEGLNHWFPELDKSHWERPEDWARVIAFLVGADPKAVTGRIIYSPDARLILEALAFGSAG